MATDNSLVLSDVKNTTGMDIVFFRLAERSWIRTPRFHTARASLGGTLASRWTVPSVSYTNRYSVVLPPPEFCFRRGQLTSIRTCTRALAPVKREEVARGPWLVLVGGMGATNEIRVSSTRERILGSTLAFRISMRIRNTAGRSPRSGYLSDSITQTGMETDISCVVPGLKFSPVLMADMEVTELLMLRRTCVPCNRSSTAVSRVSFRQDPTSRCVLARFMRQLPS